MDVFWGDNVYIPFCMMIIWWLMIIYWITATDYRLD